MTCTTMSRMAVCAAALMSGTAAMADVTAQEVWDTWKEGMMLSGEDNVTIGSETYEDGILTIDTLQFNISDDDATVNADLGSIVFEERGDGTVSVTMVDTYPVTIESDGETVNLTVVQSGADILVSGTPEEMTYNISADQYAVIVDSIESSGSPAPEGDMRLALNNVTGSYTMSDGDLRNMVYDMAAESIDLLVDLDEQETGTTALVSGKINAITIAANLALPMNADFENAPEEAFAMGMSIDANYSYESSNYLFDVTEDGANTSGTASTGPASVTATINSGALVYDVSATDIAAEVNSPDMPFPIDLSLAEYGIKIDFPLGATEEAQDFGMGLTIAELTVNDELWQMVDPGGELDHGPVTARLDLSGEGKLFFDLMDPEQQEAAAMAGMPGELNSLTLNDLTLRAVGAEVTGEGGFTFDNTDLQTIPGVPRPEGSVTINITGANAVMDKLVAMGLLPEDQAMMGRMMMGMFARSTGEDQLQSVIEVNEQGHVLANGQRLQ